MVSITDALSALTPLVGRTPTSTDTDWAATLGQVGNAGIFVVEYSGASEWERHLRGDEIVMVLSGATTLVMLIGDEEQPHPLAAMELIVVPHGTWHRFETTTRSQIMTVTPQPTDHSIDRPIPEPTGSVLRLDHVQLAMPAGGEASAVAFYEGILGIANVPKPAHLQARGGCWFETGDLKVHLGVDQNFVPAQKAHPALIVDDVRSLAAALDAAGHRVVDDEPLAGYDRIYADDPFGNRIEFMEPT